MNVRAEVIEAAFVKLLDRLVPKPERLELLSRVSWDEQNILAASEAALLQREVRTLTERKHRILNQLADGVLAAEDFATLQKTTNAALIDARERLSLAESNGLDLETALGYLQHLVWNTSMVFQTSDLRGKQAIQHRVFPKGLMWSGKGFGTPVTHSLYILLASDCLMTVCWLPPPGINEP